MSKIKSNRLEPRATNGSLTIGTPESYTTFEGDVQIPAYATREYVQEVVTGDVAVELEAYQKRDEKGYANGYVGLDANADIDMGDNMIHTDSIELTGSRNINVAKDTAGYLRYDGDQKIKWGNLIDIFEDVNLRDNRIKGVASPEDEGDAATKKYIDDAIEEVKKEQNKIKQQPPGVAFLFQEGESGLETKHFQYWGSGSSAQFKLSSSGYNVNWMKEGLDYNEAIEDGPYFTIWYRPNMSTSLEVADWKVRRHGRVGRIIWNADYLLVSVSSSHSHGSFASGAAYYVTIGGII